MKQIYNLLQTIEDDKQAVLACEKHLRYLKGQLSVHEEALKRITSIPEEESYSKDSPSDNGRVRITQDNWKSLGIEVGDTVEIVVSGDLDFGDGEKCRVLELDYEGDTNTFLYLEKKPTYNEWYAYGNLFSAEDELYLIKRKA